MDPVIVDFRTKIEPGCHGGVPPVGSVWEDTDFPAHVAMTEFSARQLEWKRATEIRKNPVLFTKGATKYDVEQGGIGSCWFLAMIANLPKHPQLMKKVVKEGDYNPETGVFHCRFWNFGKWEDVYTDDHLPVSAETIWGAQSSTNRNEMWVSLLEKAFAKYNGSYDAIDGGFPSNAYLPLTGGIAEELLLSSQEDQKILFRRIKNSLRNGAMVTCCALNEVHGLLAPHAYSLTGAKAVNLFDGSREQLLRLRNPYGCSEWTGRWSDKSEEWSQVPDNAHKKAAKDDGEFWICLEDLLSNFYLVTICSLTPDFDEDGHEDSLKNVLNIYGQWVGATAAGSMRKLHNPKYIFIVPKDEGSEIRSVDLVIQLIQRCKSLYTEAVSIRCDLYKVLGKDMTNGPKYLLQLLGKDLDTYAEEIQRVFRHSVKPGVYVLIPSTKQANVEKEFLIRIFATCNLNDCSEIPQDTLMMSSDAPMKVYRNQHYMTLSETHFGAWMPGSNAGGPPSYEKTHHLNPQYKFTIPKKGMMIPVLFHLLLSQEGEHHEMGLKLYQLQVDKEKKYIGEQWSGVTSWRLDMMYMLTHGDYMVVLYLDQPNSKNKFVLYAESTFNLGIEGFQTGTD